MVGVLAIVFHRSADTTRTRSHSHNKRSKQWRRDSCSAEPALGALGCADELGTMIETALSGLEVAARCGVAASVQIALIDATICMLECSKSSRNDGASIVQRVAALVQRARLAAAPHTQPGAHGVSPFLFDLDLICFYFWLIYFDCNLN